MSKLIAKFIFGLIKLIFRDKTDLVFENLALRHQLSVLERKKKPKLKNPDRFFWAWFSQIWPSWKSPLVIVKPETVINGTERASNYIGVGNVGIQLEDQRFQKKFVTLSDKCVWKTQPGEHPKFMAN